jgi:hypothetical protein
MITLTFDIYTLDWKRQGEKPDGRYSGLYLIYGDSLLYGRNVLLYIGRSVDVGGRLQAHLQEDGFIGRQPNLSYRFANADEKTIKILEPLLIVMHKPSFNSANLQDLPPESKSHPILIHNHGERGSLLLEVSNYYFLSEEIRRQYSTRPL